MEFINIIKHIFKHNDRINDRFILFENIIMGYVSNLPIDEKENFITYNLYKFIIMLSLLKEKRTLKDKEYILKENYKFAIDEIQRIINFDKIEIICLNVKDDYYTKDLLNEFKDSLLLYKNPLSYRNIKVYKHEYHEFSYVNYIGYIRNSHPNEYFEIMKSYNEESYDLLFIEELRPKYIIVSFDKNGSNGSKELINKFIHNNEMFAKNEIILKNTEYKLISSNYLIDKKDFVKNGVEILCTLCYALKESNIKISSSQTTWLNSCYNLNDLDEIFFNYNEFFNSNPIKIPENPIQKYFEFYIYNIIKKYFEMEKFPTNNTLFIKNDLEEVYKKSIIDNDKTLIWRIFKFAFYIINNNYI